MDSLQRVFVEILLNDDEVELAGLIARETHWNWKQYGVQVKNETKMVFL